MSKIVLIAAAGLLAAGLAAAQSSSLSRSATQVKRAGPAVAAAMTRGEAPQGLWCDSFGYQWNLSGSGMSGGVIGITGTADFGCGTDSAAGTLALARGLPLDVTATLAGGCYCNQFHQMQLVWNRSTGVFEGNAFAYGGCEGQAPVTLGRC
jgi:hypothetical protein